MSNSLSLLKREYFVCNDEKARVIDNNELFLAKMQKNAELNISPGLHSEMDREEGFSEEPGDDQTDALFWGDAEEIAVEGGSSEEGKSAVIKAAPVYTGPSPEELAAQAREEADLMLEEAKREAESLRSQAYEEGRQAGFDAGYQEGRTQIQGMEEAISEKERRLEQSYWEKLEEMEPLLVDTIIGVYEHVLDVRLPDDKRLILYLIGNALRGIENSRDFMIHVSPKDYPVVKQEKENLKNASIAGNATIEIIEDMTLAQNECMIETGSGIYDCGLGTQLKGLQKELKLLSYEKY